MTTLDWGLPVLFAAFVWWFSTGVILLLDGLPRPTFRWSLAGTGLLAIAGLAGLAWTAGSTTVTDAYVAFSCAIAVWGWQELSFLTGWLAGPRKRACPDGCGGGRHFVHAVEAILYHELAIIAGAALIVGLTWGAPNQVGTWTYLVLWGMRTSAKLNLFLGVRNLSEEFLPAHLTYLKSFFRRQPMNLLFPFSVTASTIIAVVLVRNALDPSTGPAATAGLMLVSALLGLAILEHWLMVVPLPTTLLWQWAMRTHGRGADPAAPPDQSARRGVALVATPLAVARARRALAVAPVRGERRAFRAVSPD
jgi:putative photosynthetic complex assembly protein 2